MNDRASFLDNDLGDESLGAVLASPFYYRTHFWRTDFRVVVLVVPM
jgi:hypothetical protein